MNMILAVIVFLFIFVSTYAWFGIFLRFDGMPLGWLIAPLFSLVLAAICARQTLRHGNRE